MLHLKSTYSAMAMYINLFRHKSILETYYQLGLFNSRFNFDKCPVSGYNSFTDYVFCVLKATYLMIEYNGNFLSIVVPTYGNCDII